MNSLLQPSSVFCFLRVPVNSAILHFCFITLLFNSITTLSGQKETRGWVFFEGRKHLQLHSYFHSTVPDRRTDRRYVAQSVTLIALNLVQNNISRPTGRPAGSFTGNVTVITAVCTLWYPAWRPARSCIPLVKTAIKGLPVFQQDDMNTFHMAAVSARYLRTDACITFPQCANKLNMTCSGLWQFVGMGWVMFAFAARCDGPSSGEVRDVAN